MDGHSEHSERYSMVVTREEARTTVALCGAIDLLALRALDSVAAVITAYDPIAVVVDLAEVTFFGASGAAFLEWIAVHARRDGHRVTVCGAEPFVIRMIEICGIQRLLDFQPDRVAPGQAMG